MSVNKPLFYVTSACTIEGLALIGSLNSSFTHQVGIVINNTNSVYVRNMFITGFYNGIRINETCFYCYFDNIRWYSAINSAMYCDGTSASGYAFQLFNCMVTFDNNPNYGFYFKNAGSIIIDNLMFSPHKCTQAAVVFQSNAPLAGIHQISNTVIEGSGTGVPGLKVVGNLGRPVRQLFIDNTYIAGDPSVWIDYSSDVYFSNCYFTGGVNGDTNNYAIFFNTFGEVFLTNCEFQVTNTPITASSNCTGVSLDIINSKYEGGYQFIYLPHLNESQLHRLNVTGGVIGKNSRPIDIQFPNIAPVLAHKISHHS